MTSHFAATVDAQRLSAAIRATLPHVAKRDDRPALRGINLTGDGSQTIVQASDGRTMGVYRFDAPSTGTTVWTAASAKAAGQWARKLQGPITIDGHHLAADNGETFEVETIDNSFPNAVRVVDDWAQRGPSAANGVIALPVDPVLLSRFARTDLAQHDDDKGHSLWLRAVSSQAPIHVSYGDHFTGLIAIATATAS